MKILKQKIILILLCCFFNVTAISAQSTENILQNIDKHFLGGGKMVIWAPEFPRFLDKPGFWDHACFLDSKVEPIFTITFLDENLKEVALKLKEKKWLPSHLSLFYDKIKNLEFQEQRALLPDDVLISKFSIFNNSATAKKLHIIVWTCQNIQTNANPEFPKESKNANFIYSLFNSRSRISWERWYNTEDGKINRKIGVALGADRYARSSAVNVSSPTWNYPYWKLTPFFEKISNTGLPEEENFDWKIRPEHFKGLLYPN